MEWYTSDRVDDVVVPSCGQGSFQSLERWKQWGLNSVNTVEPLGNGNIAVDEDDFGCETLVDVDHLVGKGDHHAEIFGVRGGISESSNCWTSLLNNQDYQLDGFPWTNQTDENFLNSLIVDDLMVNDLPTDMLLESHDMGSYQQMDSPKFPYNFDWHKEQPDVLCHNLQNMLISTDPPLENAPQQVCVSRIISDDPSMEETVLQEFSSAVQKMTNKTRLCFRDAMYRLATNSEKHSRVLWGEHGGNFSSEKAFKTTIPDQTLRFMETYSTEPRINTIDSTIADLLFNKPYNQYGDCHQDLSLEAKPCNKQPQLSQRPAFIRGP